MEAIAVVDLDVDPVRTPAGEDDLSPIGGELLGADLGGDIDAGVPQPEGLGDDAVGRPDEPDDVLTRAARICRGRRLCQGVDIYVRLRREAIQRARLVPDDGRGRTRLRS